MCAFCTYPTSDSVYTRRCQLGQSVTQEREQRNTVHVYWWIYVRANCERQMCDNNTAIYMKNVPSLRHNRVKSEHTDVMRMFLDFV